MHAGFSENAADSHRLRNGRARRAPFEAGLNEQALSALVEVRRGRGGGSDGRWVRGAANAREVKSRRTARRGPIRGRAIRRRHLSFRDQRGNQGNHGTARRLGRMIRAIGMRSVRVSQRLRCGGWLGSAVRVTAKDGGEHFAARKNCRAKPQSEQRSQQTRARQPAQASQP